MTDLPPASAAKPRRAIAKIRTNATRPHARRIAGWVCIALGKIGSLLLLWAFVSGTEPYVGDDPAGADALSRLFGFEWFGIAPLFAMTLGAVAIGLWILMGNERT